MDIKISNLSKSFGNNKVLNGFNAVFRENKINCIMGASGCGKTTLFRILLNLEKADSGTIEGLPEKISAVFQEDRLCSEFSAFKNVQIVTGKKCEQKHIENTLSSLGLADSIYKPVSEISGGMQRRVSIARAILYDASLILLDEPFKGLDEDTKKMTMDYLRSVCANRTVIFITHDNLEASYLSENIIHM